MATLHPGDMKHVSTVVDTETIPVHTDLPIVNIESNVDTKMFIAEQLFEEKEEITNAKEENYEAGNYGPENMGLNGFNNEKIEVEDIEENFKQDGTEDLEIPVIVKMEASDSDVEEPSSLTTNTTLIDFAMEEYVSNERVNKVKKPPPEKKHKCKYCGKAFTRAYAVTKHLSVHTGKKLYNCKICNKSLYDTTALKYHMRTHTGEKPFKCTICNHAFSQKQHLKDHLYTHGTKKFPCEYCNKMFTNIKLLRLHIRIHTGEKLYTCDICQKTFTKLHNLRVHMRIHTGEKPHQDSYTCTICNKVLSGVGSYKQHMRIHSVNKIACDVCGRKFTRQWDLVHHRYVHTGEKPYACEVCNVPFRRKSILHHHLKMHTGVKPFVCKICGHAFKQGNHLKVHMTTHSGIKPYVCNICGRGFTIKYRLRAHVLTHINTAQPVEENKMQQANLNEVSA